jgi:Domain of unknown function (DUF4291)
MAAFEPVPERQIRAHFSDDTIRVYQAYNHLIADAALANGTFVSPPFKTERMTWIKPSFLWMMYRAGWGYKDQDQQRILAIDISREGLAWALAHSCTSKAPPSLTKLEWNRLKDESPVRIQWDPERDIHLSALAHRAIQIGLTGEAVGLYTREWIQKITDVTNLAHSIHRLVQEGRVAEATTLLPIEQPVDFV